VLLYYKRESDQIVDFFAPSIGSVDIVVNMNKVVIKFLGLSLGSQSITMLLSSPHLATNVQDCFAQMDPRLKILRDDC